MTTNHIITSDKLQHAADQLEADGHYELARDLQALLGQQAPKSIITVNPHQLRNALDFVNPDGGKDPDQLETELSLQYLGAATSTDGDPAPAGLYAWATDSPDEGSILLDDSKSPACPQHSADWREAVLDALAVSCADMPLTAPPRQVLAKVLECAFNEADLFRQVVGWQQRYMDPVEGPSIWTYCDKDEYDLRKTSQQYEVRELVSQPSGPKELRLTTLDLTLDQLNRPQDAMVPKNPKPPTMADDDCVNVAKSSN